MSRVGAGPDRLLDEGAAETLEEAGHEVEVVRVEPQADSTNEIGAAFEIVRRVSEAVARAVENGAFPIVLSGNCFSSIGIVAGLGRDVGVVWLDAHPDFNTPDGSLSGFADGMGLSILTGTSWKTLRETVPGYRACPEANVVLVGIRDIDAGGEGAAGRAPRSRSWSRTGATEAIEPAVGRLREPRRGRLPARRPRRAGPVGGPSSTSTRRRAASRPTPSSKSWAR